MRIRYWRCDRCQREERSEHEGLPDAWVMLAISPSNNGALELCKSCALALAVWLTHYISKEP